MNNGLIKHCKNSGCGWKCCDFGSKGHIVMLPTEYESVNNVSHLKVINDNDNGGKHVKCIAKDKSNCDNGYKPIQCRTFPLFVSFNKDRYFAERSMRCPLSSDLLKSHKEKSWKIINEFSLGKNVDFELFFRNVKLNNYLKFTEDRAFVILDKNNASDILEYENSMNDDSMCMRSSNEDIAKSLLSGFSVGLLVAGEIVAYSLCYVNEYRLAFIDKCYVSEAYRGQGLQAEMIMLNLELIKEVSFACFAMVSPKNEISLKNLKKCGFVISREAVCNGSERYILKNESYCR